MSRLVYLAGPISSGPMRETHRACVVADRLIDAGLTPFVPHLTVFWEMVVGERDYERWLAYDFAVIERCDALVRMRGHSPGADREWAYAESLGIPCFMLDEADGVDATLQGWLDDLGVLAR